MKSEKNYDFPELYTDNKTPHQALNNLIHIG